MKRFCTALVGVGVVLVLPLLFLNSEGLAPSASSILAPWLSFMGKLHPVFLHLPIGIFVYIGFCELLSLLTRGKFRIDVTPALLLGSVMAVVATVFGYLLYITGGYGVSELMEEHKRDGIIFTLLALMSLLSKVHSLREGANKVWCLCYRIFITVTLIMLVSASHHGGEISHGSLFDEASVEPDSVTAQSTRDMVSYANTVKPILAEKCAKCHGEEKQKGGLRVDSLAFMMVGGDQGSSIVPGDLEKSLLISCLHLPLDDDLRMPPEGKPQLTPEEIVILEQWVTAGAPADK